MQRKDGHLSLRLDSEIIKKLDAEAEHLAAASPGMRVTRADVARKHLLRGMELTQSSMTRADYLKNLGLDEHRVRDDKSLPPGDPNAD